MKNCFSLLWAGTFLVLGLALPGYGQANRETWVDFNYPSSLPELGTFASPFNTFAEGVNGVQAGGILWIKTGTSPETATTTKPMMLRATNGPATIGRSTELSGWVDLHTHPMSHLGFGGKLLHGAPDLGSILPAGSVRLRNGCNADPVYAGSIYDALGNCSATHGGWGLDNSCGNSIRASALKWALDNEFVHNLPGVPFGGGNFLGDHQHDGIESNLLYWPHQTSKTHQQMWWEWIRRAHQVGRLNVMVALAVNNELLAKVMDGVEPVDDKSSADRQLDEITSFVGRHPDFMEIARSSADLRRIVGAGRLAVILGMEVDNIGNFNQRTNLVTAETVKAEIQRLYDKGVRYAFPIHLVDNKFGGTAVYENLFNLANRYTSEFRVAGFLLQAGEVYSIIHSPDTNVTYQLGSGLDQHGNEQIGAALGLASAAPHPPALPDLNFDPTSPYFCNTLTLGCWNVFKFIATLLAPDPRYATYATIPPGHVNAQGLTDLGKVAIKEMMRLGMMIDIDHMSDKSQADTLELAENKTNKLGMLPRPGYGQYPVNIGHNGIRDGIAPGGNTERSASRTNAARVAALGGVFGVGTGDSDNHKVDAQTFINSFTNAWSAMGNRAVAIGTDVNGQERLPRASANLNSASFYSNGFQMCTMATPAGIRAWDYTIEGVAHYGLMADFIEDVRRRDGEVYTNLMKSAESFAKMWEAAEAQSKIVP